MEITQQSLERILLALGEQLQARAVHYEIVVIGGSALLALGFVTRATRDVDVLALADKGDLRSASPMPAALVEARDRVGRDFGLGENWLNAGPTELLQLGLPDAFWERVSTRQCGPALTVHYAGRLDQIHFKLYAMVDQGGGRHEADLRTLQPTQEELIAAARWTTTHDPSPGFRTMLLQALQQLGVDNVDLGA